MTQYKLGSSKQPRTHMFGMQPYINPARRNMEDDLNIFKMGGNLNFFEIEDDLIFLRWKRTSYKIIQPNRTKITMI